MLLHRFENILIALAYTNPSIKLQESRGQLIPYIQHPLSIFSRDLGPFKSILMTLLSNLYRLMYYFTQNFNIIILKISVNFKNIFRIYRSFEGQFKMWVCWRLSDQSIFFQQWQNYDNLCKTSFGIRTRFFFWI